jgi:hypothetical protein
MNLTCTEPLQLSLSALVAVPKLPASTLAFLASPEAADLTGEVPGLTNFDAVPFTSVFFNTLTGIVAASWAHEVGHRISARFNNLKISQTLWIPNGSLGTFGAVTRLGSPLRNRQQLWDFAGAGPIAGLLVAGSFFVVGLQVFSRPLVHDVATCC